MKCAFLSHGAHGFHTEFASVVGVLIVVGNQQVSFFWPSVWEARPSLDLFLPTHLGREFVCPVGDNVMFASSPEEKEEEKNTCLNRIATKLPGM